MRAKKKKAIVMFTNMLDAWNFCRRNGLDNRYVRLSLHQWEVRL